MPPPTADSVPIASTGRRLLTEERNLRAYAQRKRQALALAASLAVVAVIAFGLAIWQLGDAPPEPTEIAKPVDPRAEAIIGAVDQYEAEPARPRPPADEPKPDPNSSFLTLRTNVPARVIIDGTVLSKRAPLTRYPVKAGTRHIVLEAIGTKQRAEFDLRFERGKVQFLEQTFDSTPRR
jgi:hypothetical protein